MSENGEIYTAGKNFTLQPAVKALTNSTSMFLCSCFVINESLGLLLCVVCVCMYLCVFLFVSVCLYLFFHFCRVTPSVLHF